MRLSDSAAETGTVWARPMRREHAEIGTLRMPDPITGAFAETGTPQKQVRLDGAARVFRTRAETGTVLGCGTQKRVRTGLASHMRQAARRTSFCVDNGAAAQISTEIRRERAGKPRIPAVLAQKRVRLPAWPLWKSLWSCRVIPAETSSRQAQIRVRVAADTGSALRRIEYVCAQNRVREGCFFPYESRR